MPETPEERQSVEELLPFYVNGTLPGPERERVERALADDDSLREEVEFLRALRGAVQESRPVRGVGELGARRLVRSIRRERRVAFLRRATVPLAVAASALIVAQAVTIGVLSQSRDPEAVTRPLGAAAELQVIFAPDAREAAIRELLLDAEVAIVDGPSALGLYRLDAADPDAALEQLRARPDLVSHVAREGPGE